MSRKPETQFASSVHAHLPPVSRGCYRMKNNNDFIGGIPDYWYSGESGDVWVEYKFIVVPKMPDTMIKPNLSSLQLAWCRDRYQEGRDICVVVGCAAGGVWMSHLEWEKPISTAAFKKRIESRKVLAQIIMRKIIS